MKNFRTVLFWMHLFAGFTAGLVIFLLALTGFVRAYENQTRVLLGEPAVTRPAGAATSAASVEALVEAAAKSRNVLPERIEINRDPSRPAQAGFGPGEPIYLNPLTAEAIPSQRGWVNEFFEIAGRIHHTLGMQRDNPVGRAITDAANFLFLFVVISGSYLWLPRVWNAANVRMRALFKPGLKGRNLEWNWHHVIGVWCLVPLFFISLTGVIVSYSWATGLLYKATGTVRPADDMGPGRTMMMPPPAQAVPAGTVAQLLHPAGTKSMDELVAVAKLRVPQWQSINIDIPQPEDKTLRVSLNPATYLHPELNQLNERIEVDRQSGAIVTVDGYNESNLGMRLRQLARGLHTGQQFGMFGQGVAALASLGCMFLCWTGMALTVRRMINASRKRSKVRAKAKAAEGEKALETVGA